MVRMGPVLDAVMVAMMDSWCQPFRSRHKRREVRVECGDKRWGLKINTVRQAVGRSRDEMEGEEPRAGRVLRAWAKRRKARRTGRENQTEKKGRSKKKREEGNVPTRLRRERRRISPL